MRDRATRLQPGWARCSQSVGGADRQRVLIGDARMTKSRIGFTLLAVATLCCGQSAVQAAAPTPAQMLQFKPKQPGVPISTPSEAELPGCKVELIKGQKLANGKTASGWAL